MSRNPCNIGINIIQSSRSSESVADTHVQIAHVRRLHRLKEEILSSSPLSMHASP